MPKKSPENWKTYKNVFDDFTVRSIFKLMTQKVIDGLESPVQIGKEANVFTAQSKRGSVIVKIYRLESCSFNKMYEYIKQDQRYVNIKKRKREIVFAWVQREYRNLMKAREAGVRVPTPITFLNNILVLEFIGDDNIALQLKDDVPKDKKKFLDAIILNLRKLYKAAGLVHGDLSEFNILNYREKPVLIDFSQATTTKSLNAVELMKRDMKNLQRFFNKHGLDIELSHRTITNNIEL